MNELRLLDPNGYLAHHPQARTVATVEETAATTHHLLTVIAPQDAASQPYAGYLARDYRVRITPAQGDHMSENTPIAAPMTSDHLDEIRDSQYTDRSLVSADMDIDALLAEVDRLTARVAELEAQTARPVPVEPPAEGPVRAEVGRAVAEIGAIGSPAVARISTLMDVVALTLTPRTPADWGMWLGLCEVDLATVTCRGSVSIATGHWGEVPVVIVSVGIGALQAAARAAAEESEWCTGCNTDHDPDECGYRPEQDAEAVTVTDAAPAAGAVSAS